MVVHYHRTHEHQNSNSDSLNPNATKTDNQTYATSPQRSRYQHIFRTFCGAPTGTAGQNGNDNTGTVGENRNTEVNDRSVGSWTKLPDNRKIPCSCKSTENYPPKFAPERVNCPRFSENSEKIFFAETLENIESGDFSERIFKNFAKNPDYPIVILENVGYNGGITNGKYPTQKNGSCECYQHLQKPDSKPNTTRFTAGLDCIRKGISCKRFIATKGRTIL